KSCRPTPSSKAHTAPSSGPTPPTPTRQTPSSASSSRSSCVPPSLSPSPPHPPQESEHGDVLVKTTGPPEGKFTFTSHDAGDHSICLATNYTSWFSHTHIRLYLDIVVGTTKPNVEQDRTHVSGLAAKVRDLNLKLEDIRREQQYQREREADYRDLSEATNARAVLATRLDSVFAEIIVLVATCAWQLRHLKVCWPPSACDAFLHLFAALL
ncbi:hypothetical protein C0993_008320, partial [Termitomyces sp. T159_Od127]